MIDPEIKKLFEEYGIGDHWIAMKKSEMDTILSDCVTKLTPQATTSTIYKIRSQLLQFETPPAEGRNYLILKLRPHPKAGTLTSLPASECLDWAVYECIPELLAKYKLMEVMTPEQFEALTIQTHNELSKELLTDLQKRIAVIAGRILAQQRAANEKL